jgi:hypothetical protein
MNLPRGSTQHPSTAPPSARRHSSSRPAPVPTAGNLSRDFGPHADPPLRLSIHGRVWSSFYPKAFERARIELEEAVRAVASQLDDGGMTGPAAIGVGVCQDQVIESEGAYVVGGAVRAEPNTGHADQVVSRAAAALRQPGDR